MEQIEIPLSELSFSQKLSLMESIWDDLTKDEIKLKSPVWHKEILEDREQALTSGKTKVSDWEDAKERIRKNLR
ncbi:MAG: addiction module protein [Deltaproteobacteria bacterium]|nr:addiction module protein [Deltaproteobacteria bacterium]